MHNNNQTSSSSSSSPPSPPIHHGMFGQVVIGPSGSGKSSYCRRLKRMFMEQQAEKVIMSRQIILVNLDPANDHLEEQEVNHHHKSSSIVGGGYNINITELIRLEDAMVEYSLGPNGALVYCIEYLLENLDSWLVPRILEETVKLVDGGGGGGGGESAHGQLLSALDCYFVFDLPGQMELFTHHTALKTIISRLVHKDALDMRLCTVHLIDAHHCTDAGKYISVLLLALNSMIHLELPHINVLSKVDLMETYGKLAFNLDFYTEVQDLNYLLEHLNNDARDNFRNITNITPTKTAAGSSGSTSRYKSLNSAIVSLIQDFSLVSFYPLCIDDAQLMATLVRAVDRANGYIFGQGVHGGGDGEQDLFGITSNGGGMDDGDALIRSVQERYLQKYLGEYDDREDDGMISIIKDLKL